jgi:predicted HTH transcriptional regulator
MAGGPKKPWWAYTAERKRELANRKLYFYLTFGGILGLVSHLLMSLFRQYNTLILQLERELDKSLIALINRGEDDSLEFKASFRYDYLQRKVNKVLEGVVVKTIAGFMNAQGGTLLIGVADDGSIVGLESDFQTLRRKDRDGYTQLLMSTVADKLGTPACRLLRIIFHQQDGKDVCRVIVLPSPVPIYAQEDNQSRFYIRTGSGTREMDIQEAVTFIKSKWG